MESMSLLERAKGGVERSRQDETERESGGSVAGLVYDGDSVEDELSKLMFSIKRQFTTFDDDEGTLNFMGQLNTAEESFCQNFGQDNGVPNRNVIRRAPRRRGTVQITASRPIDFSKLASIEAVVPSPSTSVYKGITTVLKENVNRAGKESRIVDDFWSTEMEKKISAVARRNLTRMNTPAHPKRKAVEDRNVRHARSRRGGGNSRTLCRRPIRLDLRLDAAKVSEWDQETRAHEEVRPSTEAYSGAGMLVNRPAANSKKEVPPSTRAYSGASILAGRLAADSLPDMELSPGHSPPVGVPELSSRIEGALGQTTLPGAGIAGVSVSEYLQIHGVPLISPTPPSNPVGSSMSLKHLNGHIRQRRLSFLSSTSGEGIDTGGGPKENGDIQVGRHNTSTLDWKARGRTSPQQGPTCILDRVKNALLATSHDFREDNEDGEVTDVKEAGHRKCNGSSLGEQNEPNGLQHSPKESSGKVPVPKGNETQFPPDEIRETGDFEAAPPRYDEHQNNSLTQSSTATDGKHQKRAKRRAKETRYYLEGCGSTWKEGRRKSQRTRVKPLEWWRGEKVLYTIQDSLMTVVGVCRG